MRIDIKSGVKVFAKDLKHNETTEITNNLYFFEEEGILGVDGQGHHASYEIWIETPDQDKSPPPLTPEPKKLRNERNHD